MTERSSHGSGSRAASSCATPTSEKHPHRASAPSEGRATGADHDLVDGHTAIAGDDVGDRVCDVVRTQRFYAARHTHLVAEGEVIEEIDGVGAHRTRLHHPHPDMLREQFLAQSFGEPDRTEPRQVVDTPAGPGDPPSR